MEWLVERNALIEHLDSDAVSEAEGDAGAAKLNEIDSRILTTPSVAAADLTAKFLLAVQLITEGQSITETAAAAIVREAAAFIGVGRLSVTFKDMGISHDQNK